MAPCYPQKKFSRPVSTCSIRKPMKRMKSKKRSVIPKSIHKYALANMNPFNRQCYGCRIPDASTLPSTSFYTYDTNRLSLTTSTPNYAIGAAYIPEVDYLINSQVADAGSNLNWGTYGSNIVDFSVANKQTIINQYSCIRPVAHGIRLSCPGTLVATSGQVHIALVPFQVGGIPLDQTTGLYLPNSVSQISQLPGYRKVPLAELTLKPLIIVNRPIDETAFRYNQPARTYANRIQQNQNSVTGVSVTGTGGSITNATVVGLANSLGYTNNAEGEFCFPAQWMTIVVLLENGPGGGFVGAQYVCLIFFLFV